MIDAPPELNPKDWESIVNDSESGVTVKMNKSQVKATEKLVLSVANLRLSIYNLQKVTGSRMDGLKESIDKFNDESSKLYKIYILLTIVIAVATVANVLIALLK